MVDNLYPGVAGSALSLLLGVVAPIDQVQIPVIKLLDLTYLQSKGNSAPMQLCSSCDHSCT